VTLLYKFLIYIISVDYKKSRMAYVFAVVVLVVAMICSAAVAIWSVIAGEKIKGICNPFSTKFQNSLLRHKSAIFPSI